MRITAGELNISDVIFVGQTNFTNRKISRKDVGRHSDCFFYILDGAADYCFADKTITVSCGDVMYLAKGSRYEINVSKLPYRVIFMDFFFDGEDIRESERFRDESLSRVQAVFSRINNFWKTRSPAYKTACKHSIYEIYYHLLLSNTYVYISVRTKSKLDEAVGCICENLGRSSLCTEELARLAGMSEVHFRRVFKRIYHMPPVKYITVMRVNRAKEYLACTEEPIGRVAELCGFSNTYYFSRVFKSETDMTPTAYRDMAG